MTSFGKFRGCFRIVSSRAFERRIGRLSAAIRSRVMTWGRLTPPPLSKSRVAKYPSKCRVKFIYQSLRLVTSNTRVFPRSSLRSKSAGLSIFCLSIYSPPIFCFDILQLRYFVFRYFVIQYFVLEAVRPAERSYFLRSPSCALLRCLVSGGSAINTTLCISKHAACHLRQHFANTLRSVCMVRPAERS